MGRLNSRRNGDRDPSHTSTTSGSSSLGRYPILGRFFPSPLVGGLGPVAGDVEFQDDRVVHDAVDRRRRGHGILEDPVPLRKHEVRGDHDALALVAYDVGEFSIEPGDLLCSARRSAYRSIEERRKDLGNGVRTHCDIVMKVDAANDRILAIGGNVSDAVSLKFLPAVFSQGPNGEPSVRSVGQNGRTVFAHLKLRADPVGMDALEHTPTMRALRERGHSLDWLPLD